MAKPQEHDYSLCIGAIAIQRDGHVGIVMNSESPNTLVIDGETVHFDDLRIIREDSDEEIMALARELGHEDREAQRALLESVRLLRDRFKPSNVIPMPKKFVAPAAPEARASDPTDAIDGVPTDGRGEIESTVVESPFADDSDQLEAIDVADIAGFPAPAQRLIGSLRAEANLLHKQIDQMQAAPDLTEAIESLSKRLEIEEAGRKKAEAALEKAEGMIQEAREDAALSRLEINKLKREVPTPNPSPLRKEGNHKPIECKIIASTSEAEFEKMWTAGWECWHTEFDASGIARSIWRKDNDYVRPDGSLMAAEAVALPTMTSSMETDDALLVQEVEAVFGSVNELQAPSAAQSNPHPQPLPALQGGEKESEEDVLEIIVEQAVEILPADVFPRFDKDIVKGLPISQAILKDGVEAVKQLGDEAFVDAYAKGIQAGNSANYQAKRFLSAGVRNERQTAHSL